MTPPGLVTPSVTLAPSALRPWRAFRAAMLAIGVTVLALGATPGDPTVPLWGHWSVGALAAFAASASAGVLAYRAYTRRTEVAVARGHHDRHWSHRIDAVSAGLAQALISGLLVALTFIVLNNLTGGAHVTALQATVAAGTSIGIVSLVATFAASRNETIHAVGMLMSLTVLGSLTSILTTPDPNCELGDRVGLSSVTGLGLRSLSLSKGAVSSQLRMPPRSACATADARSDTPSFS